MVTAVRESVADGMCVHFAFTHNRSHAAAFELARVMRGRRSVDLVGTGLLDFAIVLAAADVLRNVGGAFAGTTYPAPAPSPSIQRVAARAGSDPHWTNLTVTLRLMAAALGLPAIPTRSLAGTSLADGPGRAVVENPFGPEPIHLLAPLHPDVAFVHVPVADTSGNALVEGPFGEELWGAWAARRVVVTAEKVVSPTELRAIGPGPGLPGDRVDVVVEAPFGAHPQAQYVWNSRSPVIAYAEDYAFRRQLRHADRDPGTMRAWLQEWIFDHDQPGYLAKLGRARLDRLRYEATDEFVPRADPSPSTPPSRQEFAATVALRTIGERLRLGGYTSLFAGIGLSHLAAWAAQRLADPGNGPRLVAETGLSDFVPVPGDPYLFNYPNTRGAAIHDGFLRMLGAVPGRADRPPLTVLAAAQVDKSGAVNSSLGTDGEFIVGSGGANDLGNRDAEILLVMPMSPGRTPEHVDFVTTRPRRLLGFASDVGLLEPVEGELTLTKVMAEPGGEGERIEQARARCGWQLRVARRVHRIDPPRPSELEVLRSFDPARDLLA
jgi:acyl CoA:acetate/3-ketoacid CoA transferase alpha subunit